MGGPPVRPRDEKQIIAVTTAREVLAQAQDREALYEAFAEWWRSSELTPRNPEDSVQRPPTESLEVRLRALGHEELATFAGGPWLSQRPLDPIFWQFTILVGDAFAEPFTEALKGGVWREPRFYKLDSLGAFDAFDVALRKILKRDAAAADAAFQRLKASVDAARGDPAACVPQDDRCIANVRERVNRYRSSPDIDEVWEQGADPPTWPEYAFLWHVLLEVRPHDTIALLATMPHPLLIRSCLRTERLAERPDELARLIAVAPPAFVGERYQAEGSMVVLLLEVGWAAIENTAHNPDGSLICAEADAPDQLNAAAVKCREVTQTILDTLFTRADAVPLAWAWLERMISDLRLRRVPSSMGGKLRLNLPMLSIQLLASRLQGRKSYSEWIEQRQAIWQIYRAAAVLAVAVFGQSSDAKETAGILEWALRKASIAYMGIGNAMTDSGDVIATLGGSAIANLEDPSEWFARVWQQLRPIRERNWRVRTVGYERNSTGELCGLWGVAALELLPSPQRSALWASVEGATRDAWQTDRYVYAPNWSILLFRLLKTFEPKTAAEFGSPEHQLSRVLLPYIDTDLAFLDVVVDLIDQGWFLDRIRDAVTLAGFDLKLIVADLLDLKERVFKLPRAPIERIGKLRDLAEALRTFKCIYCLQERDRKSYTKAEHVVPQSFGMFENNFTLHNIVCDECNHYFGKNLEIHLARDTYEGQLRFTHGVKDASDFKTIGRSSRVAVKIAEGKYAGLFVSRRYSKDKNTIEVIPEPQVGFLLADGRYEYFLLDSVPALAELEGTGFSGDRLRSIHGVEVDPKVLEQVLAERGIPFRVTDEDSPKTSGQPDSILCEFAGTIDHVVRRAIAKISFNYLAKWQGPDFLHRPEFDMARRYIRYGTLPDYPMMSIDEIAILRDEPVEGLRRVGHIITIGWTTVHSVLAQVSLFNWMAYRISLCKEFSGPTPEIRRGHIFDPINHKIHELGSGPLEAEGS